MVEFLRIGVMTKTTTIREEEDQVLQVPEGTIMRRTSMVRLADKI